MGQGSFQLSYVFVEEPGRRDVHVPPNTADKIPALDMADNRSRAFKHGRYGVESLAGRKPAVRGSGLDRLCSRSSEEHELVMKGRHAGQAPDIDGNVYLSEGHTTAGEMRRVRITHASDWDLVGDLQDPSTPATTRKRVGLKMFSDHGT